MYMPKEKFEEIKYRYSPTITTDDDVKDLIHRIYQTRKSINLKYLKEECG